MLFISSPNYTQKLYLCLMLQIDTTKSRVMELIEATLQLSNLDLVVSYIFKGEKSAPMPATTTVQNSVIGPSLSDAQVSLMISHSSVDFFLISVSLLLWVRFITEHVLVTIIFIHSSTLLTLGLYTICSPTLEI